MTNLEMNKNISYFIGNFCSQQGISVAKLSELSGIPYMTMKRIVACSVQKIDVYTLSKIADYTHTPIMEIIGCRDESLDIYKRLSNTTPYNQRIISYILDLLERVSVAGTEQKDIAYLDMDSDRISYLLEARFVRVDGLDYGKMHHISFRSSFRKGIDYCAFHLSDNSLHPFYHKGAFLLVRREEPGEGDIGAYAWKDEGYIRMQFLTTHKNGRFTELTPITDRGRSYTIDNNDPEDMMNWIKIGVVVGVIR